MDATKTAKHKYGVVVRSRWLLAVACVLLGVLVLAGIRFATYKSDDIHYHANFALYVNGNREMFRGAQYYSEVEMCAANAVMVPAERAHMHDNANDVIHVEDHAATWGHFFANMGWYMGPDFIASPDGTLYSQDGDKRLHLVLNGQDYTGLGGLANTVIKDQDKLLVSYGEISAGDLKKEYAGIPSTARKYDTAKDPSSCSGHEGDALRERLRHAFLQ